jgi:hypothetical protein
MAPRKDSKAEAAAGIATDAENAKLEHTQGGATTRDDALDLGVPMKPGSPDEPVGPEDALGPGPKRGDYTNRLGDANYQPHETVPAEDAGPDEPQSKVVAQRPRAEDIGDAKGEKGGVTTTEG